MVVLGLSGHYHDAAAALVVDGKLVAAVQEERLSRIKNDPSLPLSAARWCLGQAKLGPGDLDAIVFYESPFTKLERVLVSLLRTYPRSWRQFSPALGSQLGDKLWVLDQIADGLGVERRRVDFVEHHRSHAASAFFVSPFEEAAVVVVDAVGDDTCTSLWRGSGSRLEALQRIEYPHSLGLFYAALTAYLGFQVNEGEYMVMGLAAFGEPRFQEEFRRLIELRTDGSYRLSLTYFRHFTDLELGFGPALEALLGPRRPAYEPWDLESPRDRRYADVAATLQLVTEEALLGLARTARRVTGSDHLCLAGGVALNCVANARLARESGFQRVFVQPAAGDAGGALGAALLGALDRGNPRPSPFASCALGPDLDVGRAYELATHMGLAPRRLSDPAHEVARRLSQGQLVALAEGRLEWGPRALGQRSLLASPGDGAVGQRIGRAVKLREPFRPFAPAVLADRASGFFADAPNDMTPFMTTVCPVLDEARARLAAVTHRDGSARVQTVTKESARGLNAVLSALGRLGHPPVVLNTSLNARGEPLASSAEDVLSLFARAPLDAALLGDVLVEKVS